MEVCDNCDKEVEELHTRQGFVQAYFVHWVCSKCFTKLEGVSFENYGRTTDKVRETDNNQARDEEG